MFWKIRYFLAAICVAICVYAVVEAVKPPEILGESVMVTKHAMSAGSVIQESDLELVHVPKALLPAEIFTKFSQVPHAPLAVSVPAGVALWPSIFAGETLVDKAPPGTVVVALEIKDEAQTKLLTPGRKVSVLAPPGRGSAVITEAEVLTEGAVVIAVLQPEQGILSSSATVFSAKHSRVFLAVKEKDATLLVGAASLNSLEVVPEPTR